MEEKNLSEHKAKSHIFGVWKKGDFESLESFLKSPALGWILFILGCFIITLLLSFQMETLPTSIRVGSVAPKDIKADQNYEITDEKSTQKNREEALRNVPAVYDYDETVASEVDRRVQEAFQKARVYIDQNPRATFEEKLDFFEKKMGIRFGDEEGKILVATDFKPEVEAFIRKMVQISMNGYIVDDSLSLKKFSERELLVRPVKDFSQAKELSGKSLLGIRGVDDVQQELTDQAKKISWKSPGKRFTSEQVATVAARFIRPNLVYNLGETEWRKTKAVAAVKPVILKVEAGESIIRSGDRYEGWHLTVLQGIQSQKRKTSFTVKFTGTFLFVALLILVTYSFASRYIRKFNPSRLDLVFLGINLITILVFVRLFAAFTSAFRDVVPFEIDSYTFYYAIPVSAGAMLVRFILNSEMAIIFGVIASALAGIFLKADVDLSIFFLISSIAAAGSVAYAHRRSSILKAGMVIGLINSFTILTIKMIQVVSVTEQWGVSNITANLLSGFVGGLNSSLYVLFFTPIVEMMFGYTTDIKLLELGNLNHPLLREMIVKAPGTYHHSQLVAVLAEAGAQAIGANPLLARVGAYFHDIGKMVKPLYFIENQQGGENRHDKLTASMSALIIASHVKDGIELAEKHRLPKVIIDMIPQHQGTKLIGYFYNKAKENEGSGFHSIKEEDYRYPGPRPQTREAGILLLADGVEAAVRSIPEKSPTKIQTMVQKIVNRSFAEEQLEECDLTLKDLRKITDSFVRVLVSVYHQRIAYPEMEEKKAAPLLEVVHPTKINSSGKK